MNGKDMTCGCPMDYGHDDTAEKVKISSIEARLRIVEQQANETDSRVSRIERSVDPASWDAKIDSVKKMVSDEESARVSDVSSVKHGLEKETTERKGDDEGIKDFIKDEKTERKLGEAKIKEAVTQEGVERKAVDNRLVQETSRRAEADSLLGQSMASLAAIVDTDRETLSSEIADVRSDADQGITAEAGERFLRDKEIRDDLTAETNRAKAAELEEKTLRTAAVLDEKTERVRDDGKLETAIRDEKAARESTDSRLANEIEDRTKADTIIGEDLAKEKEDRISGDDQTLEDAKEYADKVSAKVFRWCGAVATYSELIAITDAKYGDVYRVEDENTNYVYSPGKGSESGEVWVKFSETIDLTPYALKTEVAAEKNRAEGKEGELRNEIAAKESDLNGKITAEKERAVAAEGANATAIATEKRDREALEATLRGEIADGDATLQAKVEAEEEARKSADNDEAEERASEDTKIRSDFASADTALDAKIEAVDTRVTTEKAAVLATLDTTAQALNEQIGLEEQERKVEDEAIKAAAETEKFERTTEDELINGKVSGIDARLVEAERKIREMSGDDLDKLLEVPYARKTKVADYLYALDYHTTYGEEAKEFFDSHYAPPAMLGACSSFRKGNWYGRNYDWLYDDSVDFVVRMEASKNRHGSIGVATMMSRMTEDFMKSGKFSEYFKVVPHMLLDGVNDAGVFANINVVHQTGHEASDWKGRDCCSMGAIREILDRFDNAADAAHWVEEHVYMPPSFVDLTKYAIHFMIGDGTETWIVEDGKAHRILTGQTQAMTNFRLFNEGNYTDGIRSNIAKYDPYGSGVERYNIIKSGIGSVNSKDSAVELAKQIWFSRSYPSHPNPPADFWYSEFVSERDGYTLDTSDTVLRAFAEQFDVYYKRGLRDGTIWKTLHSCVYDLENRRMFIRVQEVDKEYSFAIVDDFVVDSGDSKKDKTDLEVYRKLKDCWTWKNWEDAPWTGLQPAPDDFLAAANSPGSAVPFYFGDAWWGVNQFWPNGNRKYEKQPGGSGTEGPLSKSVNFSFIAYAEDGETELFRFGATAERDSATDETIVKWSDYAKGNQFIRVATTDLLPTKTSQLENNGDGTKPFLTEHQNISGKQDKLSDEQLESISKVPSIETTLSTISTLLNSIVSGGNIVVKDSSGNRYTIQVVKLEGKNTIEVSETPLS